MITNAKIADALEAAAKRADEYPPDRSNYYYRDRSGRWRENAPRDAGRPDIFG